MTCRSGGTKPSRDVQKARSVSLASDSPGDLVSCDNHLAASDVTCGRAARKTRDAMHFLVNNEAGNEPSLLAGLIWLGLLLEVQVFAHVWCKTRSGKVTNQENLRSMEFSVLHTDAQIRTQYVWLG